MWSSQLLPTTFKGPVYRLSDNWRDIIPDSFADKPVNYLEIGAFLGANVISVDRTFCRHPESRIFCIDPWSDYSEYNEYTGEQESNFELFTENTQCIDPKKLIVKRGLSQTEIPKLLDNYFDLIYIDGNHKPEFVLEDAVLAFRKLKVGGYMIFDDVGWAGDLGPLKGIEGFCHGYYLRIEQLGVKNYQCFVRKTS
jgi:predicted O-methyltransferase YrrM